MQFKRMLLMCSALITVAYSFPTETQQNTTILDKNETNNLNTKENKTPLVFIMEEKDPESDSVVVEFVYTRNGGNSFIKSAGNNKDKYDVDKRIHEDKISNSSRNEEKKVVDILNVPKTTKMPIDKPIADTLNAHIKSLMPEEESPLSGRWPKYFYQIFDPIQPFPELQHGKSNQINREKLTKENDNKYLPYNIKERKEIPYVSGPQLDPLSIYDREFNVPIFD